MTFKARRLAEQLLAELQGAEAPRKRFRLELTPAERDRLNGWRREAKADSNHELQVAAAMWRHIASLDARLRQELHPLRQETSQLLQCAATLAWYVSREGRADSARLHREVLAGEHRIPGLPFEPSPHLVLVDGETSAPVRAAGRRHRALRDDEGGAR